MGQLKLFDERKLYLCERELGFEVLNGDDFNEKDAVQILWYPNNTSSKSEFEGDVRECFSVKVEQIVWLKPEEIPRVKAKCCKCKKIKSFEKYDAEHFGDKVECNRCMNINRDDKDFMEEMRRQEEL